jgi:hypothetical protein
MPEQRVSSAEWAKTIESYLKLLEDATKIEVDLGDGKRKELERVKREAILQALKDASGTLADGCQQTVYGLFLTT